MRREDDDVDCLSVDGEYDSEVFEDQQQPVEGLEVDIPENNEIYRPVVGGNLLEEYDDGVNTSLDTLDNTFDGTTIRNVDNVIQSEPNKADKDSLVVAGSPQSSVTLANRVISLSDSPAGEMGGYAGTLPKPEDHVYDIEINLLQPEQAIAIVNGNGGSLAHNQDKPVEVVPRTDYSGAAMISQLDDRISALISVISHNNEIEIIRYKNIEEKLDLSRQEVKGDIMSLKHEHGEMFGMISNRVEEQSGQFREMASRLETTEKSVDELKHYMETRLQQEVVGLKLQFESFGAMQRQPTLSQVALQQESVKRDAAPVVAEGKKRITLSAPMQLDGSLRFHEMTKSIRMAHEEVIRSLENESRAYPLFEERQHQNLVFRQTTRVSDSRVAPIMGKSLYTLQEIRPKEGFFYKGELIRPGRFGVASSRIVQPGAASSLFIDGARIVDDVENHPAKINCYRWDISCNNMMFVSMRSGIGWMANMTDKPIPPNTELFVWYGSDYDWFEGQRDLLGRMIAEVSSISEVVSSRLDRKLSDPSQVYEGKVLSCMKELFSNCVKQNSRIETFLYIKSLDGRSGMAITADNDISYILLAEYLLYRMVTVVKGGESAFDVDGRVDMKYSQVLFHFMHKDSSLVPYALWVVLQPYFIEYFHWDRADDPSKVAYDRMSLADKVLRSIDGYVNIHSFLKSITPDGIGFDKGDDHISDLKHAVESKLAASLLGIKHDGAEYPKDLLISRMMKLYKTAIATKAAPIYLDAIDNIAAKITPLTYVEAEKFFDKVMMEVSTVGESHSDFYPVDRVGSPARNLMGELTPEVVSPMSPGVRMFNSTVDTDLAKSEAVVEDGKMPWHLLSWDTKEGLPEDKKGLSLFDHLDPIYRFSFQNWIKYHRKYETLDRNDSSLRTFKGDDGYEIHQHINSLMVAAQAKNLTYLQLAYTLYKGEYFSSALVEQIRLDKESQVDKVMYPQWKIIQQDDHPGALRWLRSLIIYLVCKFGQPLNEINVGSQIMACRLETTDFRGLPKLWSQIRSLTARIRSVKYTVEMTLGLLYNSVLQSADAQMVRVLKDRVELKLITHKVKIDSDTDTFLRYDKIIREIADEDQELAPTAQKKRSTAKVNYLAEGDGEDNLTLIHQLAAMITDRMGVSQSPTNIAPPTFQHSPGGQVKQLSVAAQAVYDRFFTMSDGQNVSYKAGPLTLVCQVCGLFGHEKDACVSMSPIDGKLSIPVLVRRSSNHRLWKLQLARMKGILRDPSVTDGIFGEIVSKLEEISNTLPESERIPDRPRGNRGPRLYGDRNYNRISDEFGHNHRPNFSGGGGRYAASARPSSSTNFTPNTKSA